MAKEIMIVFVYDTQLLQREEDDPASAILYFHPTWVSDQQRTSLCGQIIGTAHFLTDVFKSPRVFSLQTGKFAIRTYGRYLMAVGTDRNVANWVLEHRADTLISLVRFYHCDFNKLVVLYPERANLSAKLYFMFEAYLKILMYGSHMFYNIPTLHLPKSASHVFLETLQFLQWCQQLNHVLGGTVLYHNKVVATQLSADVTKLIVLTDPYRNKSPAEGCYVDFSMPLGIQLLLVYITKKEYTNLVDDAAAVRTPLYKAAKTKPWDPILSAMKRNQSIIFTSVPEEDSDEQIARPTSLALQDVVPQLPHKARVCSTPMTDLNKLVHQNVMSICVNPTEDQPKQSNNYNCELKGWCIIDEVLQPPKQPVSNRRYSCYTNTNDIETRIRLHSLCDPAYPFVKPNGRAISQWLFNKNLSQPTISFVEYVVPHSKPVCPPPPAKKPPRKPLSLPLKSLTTPQAGEVSHTGMLTPLMAKLSFDEAATPGNGEVRFTPFAFRRQKSVLDDVGNHDLKEVVLLVCGQQDMVLGLLLDSGDCSDVVNQVWEKSTETLGKLQRQLRHSLETYQGSSQSEMAEPYSYLCTDTEWDTTHRGGPWGGTDLGVLTHLHRDFTHNNLTEIILRNEESVVYGHHCGNAEVFYQQAATNTGLPTPADLMGTVALKAKRRLERDHAIILL